MSSIATYPPLALLKATSNTTWQHTQNLLVSDKQCLTKMVYKRTWGGSCRSQTVTSLCFSVNSGTWVFQQSVFWWKSTVQVLAQLGQGTDPVSNVTQLLSTATAVGCGRHSGWKHKERKESALQNHREMSVCLLNCTHQSINTTMRKTKTICFPSVIFAKKFFL